MSMTEQMRFVLSERNSGRTLQEIGASIRRSKSTVAVILTKALREQAREQAIADGISTHTKISDLPITVRSRNCLQNQGYDEVRDIFEDAPYDFGDIANMGKESVIETCRALLKCPAIPDKWRLQLEKEAYVVKNKKPKQFDRMMANLERAMELAPSHAGTIIADAAQALHKAIRIAEAGEEWERFDLIPTAGPRTGFMGRLLCEQKYITQQGREKERELYQTQGGALVALAVSCALNEGERDRVTVDVAAARDDAAAQQAEIMAAWRWDDGAMKMAKKLGWNTAVWID